MKQQNPINRPLRRQDVVKEGRTSRFNLPIRYTSIRHFLKDQVFAAPMRMHHYRELHAKAVEDMFDDIDCGSCG